MKPFTRHTGLVVPIDRPNVDTDAIIPKQFLKAINRTGFGVNLFDEWRYLDKGEPGMDCSTRSVNSEFSLNFPQFKGASVLIARENFGCGSSREHAVWALDDYGIRVVLAPSYSDIFFNNCFKNGVLPIRLSEQEIDHIFKAIDQTMGFELTIDLEKQQVCYANQNYFFEIDAFRKHCLLNGLDDIGLTLTHSKDILMYETKRKAEAPWLFV